MFTGGGIDPDPTDDGDLIIFDPGVSGESVLAELGLLDPLDTMCCTFSCISGGVTGTLTGIA